MRGIVLAGGTGSRLGALTRAVNKHLLPVGGWPMIYWPLDVLLYNGITDITIVSSARGVGQLAESLGGVYTYRVQDEPGGIAQAIACADDHSGRPVAVVLGDNVFLPSPSLGPDPLASHARCFLKEVLADRLRGFGVPSISVCNRITRIDEKPRQPASGYAVTGLYVFGADVFRMITNVRNSARGEMEVTELLNFYATCQTLSHDVVDGFWGDAGTLEGMTGCSAAVYQAGYGAVDALGSWKTQPRLWRE